MDTVKKILFISLFVLLPLSAFSATHYIRQSGGGGGGTTWTDAYNGVPAILTRGDTYVIAGGSYGSYEFNDTGTTLITIRKASSSVTYNDDAVTGWSSAYESDQVVFSGWDFRGSGYYIEGVTPETAWAESGYGIQVSTSSNYTILAAGNVDTNNITLRNIDIINSGGADTEHMNIYTTYAGGTRNSWTIAYSWIHGATCVRAKHTLGASDWVYEYNLFEEIASGSCHGGILTFWDATDFDVRYNKFELDTTWGTGVIGAYDTPSGRTNTGHKFYGNVFIIPDSYLNNGTFYNGDSSVLAGSYDDWVIVNNTFDCKGTGKFKFGGKTSSSYYPDNWTIENNIWVGCTIEAFAGGFDQGTATVNYNYFNDSTPYWSPGANSVTSTESTSVLFDNYAGYDYHIAGIDSEAYAAGIDLGDVYDEDVDGIDRDPNWTIGAYEYESAVPPNTITGVTIGNLETTEALISWNRSDGLR